MFNFIQRCTIIFSATPGVKEGVVLKSCSRNLKMLPPRFQATRIDYWEYCPMSWYVVNQRRRPLTGSNNVNITDAQLNSENILGIAVEMLLLANIPAEL